LKKILGIGRGGILNRDLDGLWGGTAINIGQYDSVSRTQKIPAEEVRTDRWSRNSKPPASPMQAVVWRSH
jgi:hypothetical protein